MRKILLASAGVVTLLALGSASAWAKPKHHAAHAAKATAPAAANPLLADWTGAYGGVPPFDKVKVEDFKPALETAMAQNLREVETIADNPAAATFDNTIVPLENSGRALNQVQTIYGIWASTMSSPAFQKVEEEMSPKLAALNDQISQNTKLFARIQAIWDSPEKAKLTAEQQRLVWVYWNGFIQQGAKLSPADKAKYSEYNQKLATLYTRFGQNELWDEEHYALTLDGPADLAGLPQSQIDAAAAEAERRGQKGHWVIANTRSSMEPFLTYSSRRDLREKGWRMWINRGDNADAHDNNAIAAEILQLRAKRSQLLGYPTYAHWHLADAMAKTPDNAMALMLQVWKPAVEQVHRDVADMQTIVDSEKGGFKIQPWDYRYYAEKVRKARYDLDLNEVKPYLQLEKVREAMFWSAGRLYGYSFTEVKGLPTALPEIRVYEVKDRAGKHIALWYFDPYARSGKRSGAWMNAYRNQERFAGDITTIVSNNANFIGGKPGEPVTISWDDAKTMFHEFGHALHGMSSNVTYPTLSGTAVARDYVEFPSQFNENYLTTPEVLNRFLVNAQGQPMPPELIAKIKKAHTFNEGFDTVELLASAIVDMRLHLEGDRPVDPKAFEKKVLGELGMPSQIVMRHRIPQFGHVFQGEGYAAGYYGYIWAEVLDHDAFEAFEQAGDPYDPVLAKRLHDEVLQIGNKIDPAEAYRRFRGRDPKADALLRDHGFPVPN
jgi:peptidyl-dipeptidase Dcp